MQGLEKNEQRVLDFLGLNNRNNRDQHYSALNECENRPYQKQ